MARLAVLQPDPRAAARLNAALACHYVLVECPCVNSFWETVMTGPVDGCVVDIYHPRALAFAELQRLRRRQPPLAIVVYSDFSDHELDLFDLGRLKIDGVILTGATDQPAATRGAVAGALATAAAMGVTAALHGQLHPFGIDCLRWSIEHAEDKPTVAQMAEALGLATAALARELSDRRLPAPSRLVLWGRLFRAARMLDDLDGSVEQAAFSLGYSSAAALGRAFRRATGFTPTELRKRGALACAVDGFLHREARRRARHA